MKKNKSKFLLATLLSVFTLTVLFAASTEADGEGRKFWGSSTECGPCISYNDGSGLGVNSCIVKHYAFFLVVDEYVEVNNCIAQ